VPTHLIGATLLRGEWETAVSLILDPREGDILLLFLYFVRQFFYSHLFLTQVDCRMLSMALQEQFLHAFLN
jgi:tRNA(Glu) U13 pseudouridine synthase TruD